MHIKYFSIIIILLFSNVVNGQNLLTNNPNFETGNLSGFNTFGTFSVTSDAAEGSWAMLAEQNSMGSFYSDYATLIPFDGTSDYRLTVTFKASGPFFYAGVGAHFMYNTTQYNEQVALDASTNNNAGLTFTNYTTVSADILAADLNALSPAITSFRIWIYGETNNATARSLFVDNIILEKINTLPVELISFNVSQNNKEVHINWSTSSESNSKLFEVKKSFNGKDWVLFNTLQAAGNSNNLTNYQVSDNQIDNCYYQLNQVDFDGTENYLGTIYFEPNKFPTISIFPNPTNDKISVINLPNNSIIEITDLSGKELASIHSNNNSRISLELKKFSVNTIVVKVVNNNKILFTKRILIN